MLSDVNQAIKIGAHQPRSPLRHRIPRRLTGASRWLWTKLVDAISGPALDGGGIDESAFPSGFIAPYAKGSRQVRNLWHQPF